MRLVAILAVSATLIAGPFSAGRVPAAAAPNGPQAAYYVQPQFVSSAGYGFLLDQAELADWHLDSPTVRMPGRSMSPPITSTIKSRLVMPGRSSARSPRSPAGTGPRRPGRWGHS